MNKTLTQGPILKSIILFSLPLIFGNILQQFYNVIDTYIVGHYLGAHAIAAVGTTYSIITFITSVIIGLCMGAGVLFSMLYGACKEEDMRNSFVISFFFIGLLSLLIMFFSLYYIDNLLVFMNVPLNIFQQTKDYLSIICYGIVFTFLYNYFSCILRALGDSKTPLFFLVIATILNIILDIFFVVYISKTVKSVAYATIIAQGISALLMMTYTYIKKKAYRPKKEDIYFNQKLFTKFISYSLLTSLQQSIMNFGIMLIQGLVNSYGVAVMAGFSTAVKIDTIAYMPVQDFGNAFSTFVAQNYGANEKERVKQGLKISVLVSFIFSIVISLFVFLFSKELMMIFLESYEKEAIQVGIQYLRIEGVCYCGIGLLFLWYGYYRGIGKAFFSVILTIVSLGTRVVLSYLLSPSYGLMMIWLSIPIGWFLADIIGLFYYRKSSNK